MYLQEEDGALLDDFVERSGRTPLFLKTREMLIDVELRDQHTRRGWADSLFY